MFTKFLIFIKHNLKFLWTIIESINSRIFSLLFSKKFKKIAVRVISEHCKDGLEFRILTVKDIMELERFLKRQREEDLRYFKPHGFDYVSLFKVVKNKAFLMMGAYENESLIGYFFLRCFINRKCFVGRIVDFNFHGKGLGKVMNEIMYSIAWGNGFRCLSTISKNNKAIMAAHAKNKSLVFLKELENNYWLVEFIDPADIKNNM